MTRRGSNEATLNGKRIVIKCAGPRNRKVGVSKRMLPSLQAVVAAFQGRGGVFEVISLGADTYKKHMTDTRSNGPSAGRVGEVTKNVFMDEGDRVSTVQIDP